MGKICVGSRGVSGGLISPVVGAVALSGRETCAAVVSAVSSSAMASPLAAGDSPESSTKCYLNVKDLGYASLGYGGAPDCPDSSPVVSLTPGAGKTSAGPRVL